MVVAMLGLALLELGLEREGTVRHKTLAGIETGYDFDVIVVATTELDRMWLEAVLGLYEDNGAVFDVLER
jgi:hypothetical protein